MYYRLLALGKVGSYVLLYLNNMYACNEEVISNASVEFRYSFSLFSYNSNETFGTSSSCPCI